MAQQFDSRASPFYRNRHKSVAYQDKGNYGPAIFGPYLQRWDPVTRQWRRPDGSRARLAGLGDTVLPTLDLSNGPAPSLFTKEAFLVLGAALVAGLGAGWAFQHHYKTAGFVLLGVTGVAGVFGAITLKQNVDAVAAADAYGLRKEAIA